MEIAMLVFNMLLKAAPELYEFIKGEIDGGADIEVLRNQPVTLSVAFGGGAGKAIVVQEAIEADMADPSAR